MNLANIEADGADARRRGYGAHACPYQIAAPDPEPSDFPALRMAWLRGWHGRGIVADRLRAAAEFRRAGEPFEALLRVMYARRLRLTGAETGARAGESTRDFAEGLAERLWRRVCALHDF
jgi:hypothetical protein